MKKKIFNIALALTLVVAAMSMVKVDAQAAKADKSYEWGVSYNGKQFNPTIGKEYNAAAAKINDAMPGDTIEYVAYYENLDSDKEAVDFYLNANIVKSLEDTSSAAGGGYTFKVTNTDSTAKETVLFDSETGGDAQSAEGAVGLNLVNGNQGAYFSLGTVPYGKSGKIVVSIVLDGKSQTNDYMAALADLKLVFSAEKSEVAKYSKTVVKKEYKTVKETKRIPVSEKKTIVQKVVKTLDNGTQIVAIDDADVPLAGGDPKTGDSVIPMVVCSIMFVIGMCMIIWYAAYSINNRKKEVV